MYHTIMNTAPRLSEAVVGFKAGAYVRDVIKLHVLGFLAMLFLSAALLPMPTVTHEQGRLMPLLATAAEAQERSWQTTDPEKTPGQTAVTVGMRKEAVRALWGEAVEIRKIRTCFGTKEEWVFQGDLQRFGARERSLHFDEDEVFILDLVKWERVGAVDVPGEPHGLVQSPGRNGLNVCVSRYWTADTLPPVIGDLALDPAIECDHKEV